MKYLFVSLSVAFAAKAGFSPDTSSVVLSLAFLGAYLVQHFFGTDTISAKLVERVEQFENDMSVRYAALSVTTQKGIADATKDLTAVKEAQAQYNLSAGIQSNTRRFI